MVPCADTRGLPMQCSIRCISSTPRVGAPTAEHNTGNEPVSSAISLVPELAALPGRPPPAPPPTQ
eukprot:2018142-Prorocentrum_lima.AAC.1